MLFGRKILIFSMVIFFESLIHTVGVMSFQKTSQESLPLYQYDIDNVEDILIRGPIKLEISQSEKGSVFISHRKEDINFCVENKKLILTADGMCCNDEIIFCKISVPRLKSMELINIISCNIVKYKSKSPLAIYMLGSICLKGNIFVPMLTLKLHGELRIRLQGEAATQYIVCTGGTEYQATGLKNKDTFVNAGKSYLTLASERSISGIQGGGSTIFCTKNPLIEVKAYSAGCCIQKKSGRAINEAFFAVKSTKSLFGAKDRKLYTKKNIYYLQKSFLTKFNAKFKLS